MREKDFAYQSKRAKKEYFAYLGELYGADRIQRPILAQGKALANQKGANTPKKIIGLKRKKGHPEYRLVHAPLMKWARLHPICREYLIHIPNERKCSPVEGYRLRMMGVKAGVSDLFLAYPNAQYKGFWIELKAPNKKMTVDQIRWHNKMIRVGYLAQCFDDWEQVKDAIVNYLRDGL